MDYSKKVKRRSGGLGHPKRHGKSQQHQNGGGRVRKHHLKDNNNVETNRRHSEDEEMVDYTRSTDWVDSDKYNLWPPWGIWVIYIVTLIYRVCVIKDTNSWWILHPDEIFQSLEVAHSEVYGYGFRPYEYLPPHSPSEEMTSLADKQEAEMGMYSLRSWLYPRLYMLVFHMKEWVGNDDSPFLVGKLFHGVVAAHLPLAVFAFTNCLTCSPDIATSAAILVAFSEHLATLGTHTLINSFLAPIIFGLLAILHSSFIANKIPAPHTADENDVSSADSDASSTSSSGSPKKDMNGNAKLASTRFLSSGIDQCDRNGTHNHSNGTNRTNRNGNVKTVIDQDSSLEQSGENGYEKDGNWERGVLLLLGFSFAILVYIRVDMIMFCAVLGIFLFTEMLLSFPKHFRKLTIALMGGALGLLLGGLDDLHSYGQFMLSPYQWVRFNVITDLSDVLFGWNSAWTYIDSILNFNVVTRFQTFLIILTLIYVMFRMFSKEETDRNRQLGTNYIRLVLATVALFIVYSLKGHKEVRFLHNVIVLFQISSAMSFSILYRKLVDSVQTWHNTIRLHGRMFYLLFIVHLALNFASPKDRSNQAWSYRAVWDSHHVNECLDFIRQQPDVTGVVSDRILHETAAYSILHNDVPIFTLFHYEFMEFEQSARKTLSACDYFSSHQAVSVSVTSKVSNFITTENSPLLLKTVVNDHNYNYLLLKKSRKLVNVGFREVFSSGSMRVLKRTQDIKEVEELQKIADAIPIGRNATILEYEGSWLMTYGLRHLAAERLEAAVALDTSRIRAFQLLSKIYQDMGRGQDARDMTLKCFVKNGRDRCMEVQSKVVIHQEYLR